MDKLHVSEICLDDIYDVLSKGEAYFTATEKSSGSLLKVYTIDLNKVKRATSRDNIVKKLHIYRGLHLLPCMSRLQQMHLAKGVLHVEQRLSENGTLHDEIASCVNYKICISEESIKIWLTQVLIALDALHRRKVVHGCVKAHNLFLEDNKNFVRLGPTEEFLKLHVRPRALNHEISVFKTVRAELREKSAKFREDGRDVANVEYLPPELLNPNNDIAFSNDIWSLGIVIYRLATLHAPFEGSSPLEITMGIEKTPLDVKEVKKRGYSNTFIELLQDMLNKDPLQRPSAKGILSYTFLPSKMHFGC